MALRTARRRLGVFGGSFDPPHVGHLIIAEQARQQLGLSKVVFIPVFIPPHKKSLDGASPLQRVRMLELSIRGNSSFEISRLELRRKGTSYTVETLRAIKERHPDDDLFLILGSDNLLDFRSWKSPEEILARASLGVYEREGFPVERAERSARVRAIRLSGDPLNISSSALRRLIKEGKSIRYLVPDAVRRFIEKNKVYEPSTD